MTSVKLSSLIQKFHSVWRASLNQTFYTLCEGGRGSGKSSDVAHIIILIMRYAVNAVCVFVRQITP